MTSFLRMCSRYLVFSFFTSSSIACAGLIDECSWTTTSPDGQYLLVMLTPETLRIERQKEFETYQVDGIFDEEGVQLRKKYSESGVYANDGSTAPLWTLPYHIQLYEVYFSENGEHLLLAQEVTNHSWSNIPVGGYLYFYHKDGSQQSWAERQIGWGWGLKHLLTYHLFGIRGDYWTTWTSIEWEPTQNTYTIKTEKGESFTFDLTTGQIIRSSSVWNRCLIAFFAATPILVYFLLRNKGERSVSGKTFRRYSVRDLLLFVTAFSIWFWLGTLSWLLAIAIVIASVIGGGIAWIWSRKVRSWITGSLLAVYGCVWGLFLWSILIEPLIWESQRDYHYIWFLPIFGVLGLIAGGMLEQLKGSTLSVQSTSSLSPNLGRPLP